MKRTVSIALIVAAALVLLIILGLFLLQSPPVKDYAVKQTKEYVRRQYGTEMELGKSDYNLLTGEFTLRDLSFRPQGAENLEPVLRAKSAHFDLDLATLFSDVITIKSARLQDVDLNVVIAEDGKSNLPKFEKGDGKGPSVLIEAMEVQNATIKVEDRRQQIAVQLPSVGMQVQGRSPELIHEVSLETGRSGIVRYRDNTFDIRNLDIKSEVSPAAIRIEQMNLVAADSKVKGSGTIRDLSDPRLDMTFDTDVDLATAAVAAGLTGEVRGRARGTINVRGPIESLHISGDLDSTVR